MPRRVAPYWKLLAQPQSALPGITKRGNNVLDILASSRVNHYNSFNVTFWNQPTLKCYTPAPLLKAAHSMFDSDGADVYGTPTLKSYPVVKWRKVAGTVSCRTVIPDGSPAVGMVKVMDNAPAGSVWGLQTSDMGPWSGDLNAGPGQFGLNRSIAVTVIRGRNDAPETDELIDLSEDLTHADYVAAENAGRRGDVRVMVGNRWSVKIPGDGGAPTFEKKISLTRNGGLHWDRLHTFVGVRPEPRFGADQWLVTFCAVGGRLAVSVSGREFSETSFVYFEANKGRLKALEIPAAPVHISGRAGGGPTWIGLRRIEWAANSFFNSRLPINDAVIYDTKGSPPSEGELTAPSSYVPVIGGASIGFQSWMLGPIDLEYQAFLYPTTDRREPSCLKWVLFKSDKESTPGTPDYIDYSDAILSFEEHGPEPDFSGAAGTRGSDAYVDIVFDAYKLDEIAAANSSNWRNDLGPYMPATWVLGSYLFDSSSGVTTTDERARVFGYFDNPSETSTGFNQTEVRRRLVDPMIRLREPAGFIDPTWHALDCVSPENVNRIYGWEGIRYILEKAIDPTTANTLRVHMPADWPSLFDTQLTLIQAGSLPANDVPLWKAPYGKYAAEWMKEIAEMDCAALYWAGNVPIYGQYDMIVAGCPTYEVYDGSDSLSAQMPDSELQYTYVSAGVTYDTHRDYNRYVVWGKAPGGVSQGDDATKLGTPLVNVQSVDRASVLLSWERTKLFGPIGRFFDPSFAARFVRTVERLAAGHKAALGYSMTFPFALHEVFWGSKFHINASASSPLHGKTLRVFRIDHSGSSRPLRVEAKVQLVEVINA